MNLTEKAADIEGYLASTLQPVFPRPQFIDTLKGSLDKSHKIFIEPNRMPAVLLTIAIGVVAGTLLLGVFGWLSKLGKRR